MSRFSWVITGLRCFCHRGQLLYQGIYRLRRWIPKKTSTRSTVLGIGVILGASLALNLRSYVRSKWGLLHHARNMVFRFLNFHYRLSLSNGKYKLLKCLCYDAKLHMRHAFEQGFMEIQQIGSTE